MICALVDENTGPKLQRIIRTGRNPISILRAEILLSSALGSNIAELENQYHLDEAYIIKLITDFNRIGMDAVTAGTRGKRSRMTPEECSIVVDVISMPPSLFGLSEDTWNLDSLLNILQERKLVQVIEPVVVARLLDEHQG